MSNAGQAMRQDEGDGTGVVLGSIRPSEVSGRAEDRQDELERLRSENRRLAVSLGAFSAFIASKGLLEEAWHFIHNVHQLQDEDSD